MPKKITKEGLEKLNSDAFKFLKDWVTYISDLRDYTEAFNKAVANQTTPPGNPPKPPGIP